MKRNIITILFILLNISPIHCVRAEVTFIQVGSFGRAPSNAPGEFNYPSGMGVDSSNGDVFVMDESFKRIQRFDSSGYFITQWPLIGGLGIAVDATDHAVYVVSPLQHMLFKFDANGQVIWTRGTFGTGQGQFNTPRDVAVNPVNREVFVLDTNNKRVQRLSSDGTFIGEWSDTGLLNPHGIAIDPTGSFVYIANSQKHSIKKYDLLGNVVKQWGSLGNGPGQFRWPRGVAVNSKGHVYIADSDNERVQEFDADGNFIKVIQGPHDDQSGPFHPRAIDINIGTDEIYVAAGYAHRIDRFNPDGSYQASWGHHDRDGEYLNRPRGVAINPQNGDIFVGDTDNHLIKRFSNRGTFLSQFGSTIFVYRDETAIQFPSRMAFDADANLWLLNRGLIYLDDPAWASDKYVRQFDSNGTFLSGFAYPDFRALMNGLALNNDADQVYVASPDFNKIMVFDFSGAFLYEFGSQGAGPGQFNRPAGIALDLRNKTAYVVDSGNNRIQKFTLDGHFLLSFGTPGAGPGEFGLSEFSGVALDDFNNLYVADVANHRIQVFDLDGQYVSEIGFHPGYPTDIAVNNTTLVAADTGIQQIDIFEIVPDGESNNSPVIGGQPNTSVMESKLYSFIPTARDPDAGDTLTFSIINKPSWADFNTVTGELTGTPNNEHLGTTNAIIISVNDGRGLPNSVASLDAFKITVVGYDSNGDGISDVQAIAIGLDPYDIDTDDDGIPDAREIGSPGNPLDTDTDGVIDALEAGDNANDASIVSGLKTADGIDIQISSPQQTLSSISLAPALGGPTDLSFPYGAISFKTTSPLGGSVTVQIIFGEPLPSNFKLYKINNAGEFILMPTGIWKRINNTSIEITLTDGDLQTDQDDLVNGEIYDPFVLAVDGSGSKSNKGGGCTVSTSPNYDATLLILLLVAYAMYFKRKQIKTCRHDVGGLMVSS